MEASPRLDPQNVLWYFGALAGTGACVAIDAEVPQSARGVWILLVSLAFLAAYAVAVVVLRRRGWLVPGGVLAATAVTFVPIAGASFERLAGVIGSNASGIDVTIGESSPIPTSVSGGNQFHGSSFALALVTLAAGLAVYTLVRYSYVFLWVAVAALIATQICVPAFDTHPDAASRFDAALAVGLLFVALGLSLDRRGWRRQAFWWHLVGLAGITSAFAYHVSFHGGGWWVATLAAGLAAVAVAVLLQRVTFAFFALLGVYAPFVHYSSDWFGNLGTAAALAVIAFSLLALGLWVQRERGPAAAL